MLRCASEERKVWYRLTRIAVRLVFTYYGIGVGVVIRSAERYDLVKIKPTESEEEYRCCLQLRPLRSSENQIAGVVSRRLYSEGLRTGIVMGWFLRFYLRHRQSSFHWIIGIGVISGIRRNGKRSGSSESDSVELMTPDFRFLTSRKHCYDSDHDSDSDSVASDNQPLVHIKTNTVRRFDDTTIIIKAK